MHTKYCLRFFSVILAVLACLTVCAQAAQVQLAWDPPVYPNGTSVTTLAGYKLYYGRNTRNYPFVVNVGKQTNYTITNLASGTIYFAVTAYTVNGEESDFSAELSTIITDSTPSNPISANLVSNGDMEQGGWTHGSYSGTNPSRTWATDSVHSGTHALKMTSSTYFYGYWNSPRITVTVGARYDLSLWVKTAAITQGVTLNINWYDASQRWLSWQTAVGGKVSGTTAWRQISGGVTAPAQARTAVVHIRIESAGGSAWIDDVRLQLPTPTPAPTASQAQALAPSAAQVQAPTPTASQVMQHMRWEASFTSTKTYANPFLGVTLRVQYTKDGSAPVHGYGFWDGGKTFKIRTAFQEPGRWQYTTTASDASDTGLHNQRGVIDVLPYTGNNPLYKHGFLQISADGRGLEHADGTPFLWLADTLWGATVWLTEQGFQKAIEDRRSKHFTVLKTNFARKAEVDTAGETPWAGDRWNVRFMQKLDRMFNYANDAGIYLFINGLVDLKWDRHISDYKRFVEMIAIRYAGHHLSFSASMDDTPSADHEVVNAAVAQVSSRHLLTQHLEKSLATTEQYYDEATLDYVMVQTGSAGNLEVSCSNAIEWPLRLYDHVPPKPVVNGETWYEGYAGGTAEIATHLAYLTLLSGGSGYSYGTALWNAKDTNLPAWKAYRGSTYMKHLYDLFMTLDEGRPLVPRHELIRNQATSYANKMVIGVSSTGTTYAAFLPRGGTIALDLGELSGPAGVKWYNPFTGTYAGQTSTTGGTIRSFTAPFGTAQAILVIAADKP